MSGEIPAKEEIRKAAEQGRPIMEEDVSQISQAESEITGGGPIPAGPAATAHSFHSRQRNFENKADDILSKPSAAVTKDDAAELQKAEARARGHPPDRLSLSSDIQSLADENENEARMEEWAPVDAEPAYVTKDDAREVQSWEEKTYGSQAKGGLASQMQSSADKLDNARQGGGGSM